MPFFDYNIDIPDAPNNPSDDQPLMKENTNSTNSILAVDHASFNDNDGGYHTVIHQVKQVSDPAAIAGVNQIYAKDYTPPGGTTDTQTFSITGGGIISQLTGYKITSPAADIGDGYQWVGGILIQWGFVTYSAITGTVTFASRAADMIPFPNNCFVVTATASTALFATNKTSVMVGAPAAIGYSKTHFDYEFINTNVCAGFTWIAIGN